MRDKYERVLVENKSQKQKLSEMYDERKRPRRS
jgi:hypothetical protein